MANGDSFAIQHIGSTVENSMNMNIIEGQSILTPPHFDGTNFTDWKELMKIFIQSVDFKIWLVIKNGPKIPKKLVDNQEVEKCEEEFDDEDMKNMELEAKAKYVLHLAIDPNAFKQLSDCETTKQMWNKLDSLYLDREITIVNSTLPQRNGSAVGSIPHNSPNLEFLAETREAMVKFHKFCVPLHKFALEGNWPAAKLILEKDGRLKNAALATGWPTVLHVAAGTNHVPFVKELLKELQDEHLALQDMKGNTAFCFAAASGNLDIVRLLLDRDESLATKRGGNGHTPIQFAAFQGRCEVTCFLYDMTKPEFYDRDWELLFFTCINTGNYHLALTMATERKWLAESRDENDDTALHLLALIRKPLECQCHYPEHQNPIKPGMKKHVFFQLVNFLWTTLFSIKDSKSEIIKIINEPYQLLFDAAVVGNFEFLSELISIHPSLIWEVDNKNQSIIHKAVSYRHASIFNLIHEIGPLKDIIVTYSLKEKNTLLHLAAKSAPSGPLELITGAAFQMWLELLWFEEVKKIMPPSDIKSRNSDGLTAQELFTKEHEGLREKAEKWMKRTAEFGMLISTVIATGVFSAAINIPGGIDDQTNKPNYLGKSSFHVFALSDATALISSATAILIFLSILISRYAEYDFYGSLPLKLMFGLITLFISITSMMVAFGSAFFITYYYGLKWIPILSSVLASLPIVLYIVLQFSLWSDIICSFYYCRTLFKPSKRMITS